MNLLNDCSEVEDENAQTGGRKRGMSRRLASLRHCTVLAMSNLLNANVDSGLMHSIGEIKWKLHREIDNLENWHVRQAKLQQSMLVNLHLSVHIRFRLSQRSSDKSYIYGSSDKNPPARHRIWHACRNRAGRPVWEAGGVGHNDGRPGRAPNSHGFGQRGPVFSVGEFFEEVQNWGLAHSRCFQIHSF